MEWSGLFWEWILKGWESEAAGTRGSVVGFVFCFMGTGRKYRSIDDLKMKLMQKCWFLEWVVSSLGVLDRVVVRSEVTSVGSCF